MNNFPLTRDQWYARRDDRTNRMSGVRGIDTFSVGVIVDDNVRDSFDLQITVITSINILARWCRTIKVQMPDISVSNIGCVVGGDFRKLIDSTVKCADPYCKFSFGKIDEEEFDRLLIIGNPDIHTNKPQVCINGTDWISGIQVGNNSLRLDQKSNCNPIGPAFAACLGNAELFRYCCGISASISQPRWYSLDHCTVSDKIPEHSSEIKYDNQIDIGRTYQIGCGAVGSCLDYFLTFTKWTGIIHLLDYDHITESNCNRSLCFNAWHAIDKTMKINVCANVLSNSKIKTDLFDGDYSQFIGAGHYHINPPDLILSLANERNIWEVIQHNLPPVVFHASTTMNWGLNFGRHIPKTEWCILCRYSKEVVPKFVPVCAEGVLPTVNTDPLISALPFLSPAAAILVMAEMSKIGLEGYPFNDNFFQLSMRALNVKFQNRTMLPDPNCICNNQKVSYYPKEIISSKYWSLTKNQIME